MPSLEFLIDGPAKATKTLILAHGAGAPMDHAFMGDVADGLAAEGLRVVRFEFPYMAKRRTGGKGGPPDREPVLRATWMEAIEQTAKKVGGLEDLFIGGKSMGGRMASLVADDAGIAGLICLGYPFHPTGKPTQLRVKHLADLKTRALIVQGERDPFGTKAEVAGYDLSPAIKLHWLTDGDHSFAPRKSSGKTTEQNLAEAVAAMAAFMQSS